MDSIDEAFGKAMRSLRQQRNLSQEGMADLCRMDRTYISLLERGLKSPTLRTVGAICGYLNITLSELTALMGKHGYK